MQRLCKHWKSSEQSLTRTCRDGGEERKNSMMRSGCPLPRQWTQASPMLELSAVVAKTAAMPRRKT
jgi:hypothetical protein